MQPSLQRENVQGVRTHLLKGRSKREPPSLKTNCTNGPWRHIMCIIRWLSKLSFACEEAKKKKKKTEQTETKHQTSHGQLGWVSLTTNCSLVILREDQRATKHKGGIVCISKSKEWNGLAPGPMRATYPTSLRRLKCVALSCLSGCFNT